jgi:hypothetical protein
VAAVTAEAWLPEGKSAAICLSVDDVSPARSSDGYDAGGDLGAGALGHLEGLLRDFPQLRATLFVTPDWRPLSVIPTRRRLARVPWLREWIHLAPVRARGALALNRHPEFVGYLRTLPRVECALHGLHHLHRGPRLTVEFQRQSRRRCASMLARGCSLFAAAGLRLSPGLQPPAWELPRNLRLAMGDAGLRYVCSARDLLTPIAAEARTAMSGLRGVSLIHPEVLEPGSIVHLPVNFQATSDLDRALEVVSAGGLLSIKAHVAKNLLDYEMLDGLDADYRRRLEGLFTTLEKRFGDSLWWTSMEAVAARLALPRSEGSPA